MWGAKVKFACKVFRTEHAQIPGYPLVKDHWYQSSATLGRIQYKVAYPELRSYTRTCISESSNKITILLNNRFLTCWVFMDPTVWSVAGMLAIKTSK